jgi:geranylgeranyl diphosphate synthase, type I
MRERAGSVFAFLDDLIGTLPVPPKHKELLRVHLGVLREDAQTSPEISAVQMPLLVHEAIAGGWRPAVPVAAACTIFCLGADLLDSVIDRELPPPWDARDPAEANLAAATLLGALPQLSIARLREGTPPARLWALAELFADALLEINAGQHEDLLLSNREDVSLEDSRAMAERKSGSAGALLAKAGAVLATEDPRKIRSYAAFGSRLGTAKQLINDVRGIWGEDISQDLFNGRRTLPVVHALSTLRGEQREKLLRLLALSRESAEHHAGVRALLAGAGSVRYTAKIVWLHQQQARTNLAAASPRGAAGRELGAMLDRVSLLPRSGETRTAQPPAQLGTAVP